LNLQFFSIKLLIKSASWINWQKNNENNKTKRNNWSCLWWYI